MRVAIPDQPLRLLEVLLDHPGVVVSRDQLRERLWRADTFVDFEHGLNAAVKRLRDALGDSADHPRFIETVPKRGYKFIGPAIAGPAAPAGSPAAVGGPGRWGSRARGASAAVVLAGILALWLWPPPAPPVTSTASLALTRLTFDPGLQRDPAFSPDGRFMAYASNSGGNFDLWVLPLDGGAARRLTDHPAHDMQPAWSPDGQTILFRSERDGGGLFAISPGGGHVVRRTASGFRPRWSPDGTTFAFGSSPVSSGTSFMAAADGSSITPVAYQNVPRRLNQAMGWHPSGRLVWLAGSGKYIVMMSRRSADQPEAESAIVDDVRGRFEVLSLAVVDNQPLGWSPDGRTLNFVGQTEGSAATADVWRVSVDPESLRVMDGPVRVTTGAEAESDLAVTPGAGVAFSASTRTMRAWVMELDGKGGLVSGSARPVTPEAVSITEPALSPDGTRLLVRIHHPGGAHPPELRVLGLDDGSERVLRRINAERDDVRFPRWSPDGTRVAFSQRLSSKDKFASAIKTLDVRSVAESFVTSPWWDGTVALENVWGWSADGHSLLVTSTRYRPPHFALVRVPLAAAPRAETAARVLVSVPGFGVWQATESPNGRWVCFNQTPFDNFDYSVLRVVPAEGGDPRPVTEGRSWDDKPRWAADGRRLYFLSRRDGDFNVWSVAFDPERGTVIGQPRPVTTFKAPNETVADHLGAAELSVGGNRLAVVMQRLAGGIWMLE